MIIGGKGSTANAGVVGIVSAIGDVGGGSVSFVVVCERLFVMFSAFSTNFWRTASVTHISVSAGTIAQIAVCSR